MSVKALVERFIDHSPKFHEDLNLPEIDNKHTNILKEAYSQFENEYASSKFNFRTWKSQSDLTVPTQISLNSIRAQGVVRAVLRYGYGKLFRRTEDKFFLDAILDDSEVIKGIGGGDLLADNPVHCTPGARDFYYVGGTSVNLRWLRYIYLLKRITNMNVFENGGVWLDVGSFYGGLQGLVRKYHPKARIIMVDFHHQLCRSYIYLSSMFPDVNHILPDQVAENAVFGDITEGAFMYVPVSDYKRISDQSADLVTNFFSLGEMRREFFNVYITSPLFQESKKVYLVNRFVSSPYFEKTYDSDLTILDYLSDNRSTIKLDVFPIHHYMLVKRELFGRARFRNASSAYFEMTTSK